MTCMLDLEDGRMLETRQDIADTVKRLAGQLHIKNANAFAALLQIGSHVVLQLIEKRSIQDYKLQGINFQIHLEQWAGGEPEERATVALDKPLDEAPAIPEDVKET